MPAAMRVPRVYEQIVAHLERAIYDGALERGDKLPPERQLARDVGASRVAVREALRALEHRGLVEVRHGSAGGYFVREADDRPVVRDLETLFRLGRMSLAQLLEARLTIEPAVAGLAAERATCDDVATLHRNLDDRAVATATGRAPWPIDIAFHRLVAGIARNPVHAVLTRALLELDPAVVAPGLVSRGRDGAEIDADHRRIAEAIAAGRPEAAGAAMASHLHGVRWTLEARASAGAGHLVAGAR